MESFNYIKKFKKSNYLQFSPHEEFIVSVSGNQIVVVDVKELSEVHSFKEIKQPGKIAFAFNNEKLFASESTIKKLGVFNIESEFSSIIHKVTNSSDYQNYNIYFTPDNRKIVLGIYNCYNNTISTLDLETSEVKDLKLLKNSFVNKIEYCNSDNSYLFSIFERDMQVINGNKYSTSYILKWKYPFELNEPMEIRTEILLEWWDISYNAVSKKYALYDLDNQHLILTNENMSKEISRYILDDKRSGYFSNFNWSHDGEYIVITYLNSVKIIRVRDAKCIKEFKVASGLYSEFSKDSKLLLIGTAKNGYIVDISTFLM
ncbi:hypothetical protein [Clostridium grantii]|uniref:Uncharacterized protein n=1 Tax=Clostridium grantii DSM 8605 TaxID=1121316 RepID=A0A1M5RQP6_9CLOT|nr:hypothetical protein [Clostridium grantii]SHH28500.1 hypothetical protein SAMN02745207_00660 [Clostridium grantii DSM 8605]